MWEARRGMGEREASMTRGLEGVARNGRAARGAVVSAQKSPKLDGAVCLACTRSQLLSSSFSRPLLMNI
jgi:hypothetical protein